MKIGSAAMLLEQHSKQHSSREASGGGAGSRRLPFQADIWAGTEAPATQRLATWLALCIALAIGVLLLLGG
jgi:hypothetical protein